MGKMGIFFFSLKKNSRSNFVSAVRGISPHAGQPAQCINEYILPPTSYLNSVQQPFIPLLKKKKSSIYIFSAQTKPTFVPPHSKFTLLCYSK